MQIDEIKTKFASAIAQALEKPRGSRRFPNDFKRAIVEAMADGASVTEITAAFNLHYSTIMNWRSGSKRILRRPQKQEPEGGFNPIRVVEKILPSEKRYHLIIETPSGVTISIS